MAHSPDGLCAAIISESHDPAQNADDAPRDRLHIILDEPDTTLEKRAEKIENLRAFLAHGAIETHLWKAPWRSDDDARCTLALMKSAKAWRFNFSAVVDRMKG
ncbi:MAG: hypothetical protein AAGD13_16840 [Pseudomonadota bacterium]